MKILEYNNFYDDWINLEEKGNHEYKFIELSEIEGSREIIAESLKKVIIKYYTVPTVFEHYGSQKTGKFDNLEFYLSKKIPSVEKTRKGEFGEIFGTEFLKQKFNFYFPVNKLNKKDNKDVPVHGEDILGFKCDGDEIIGLCICECKTAKNYSTVILNEACTQLIESNINPKTLVKFHDELIDSNPIFAFKIFDVMKNILNIKKDNWIFYIIENRSIGIFKEKKCLNSLENLKLIYFNLKDMTDFVNKLYDDCGDILND